MLSRPVIEFTLIRALMKHWLILPGSSCPERSCLFPFSCGTFSKSSFCYEQAVGQIHQSHCQCIRVHHTVIPARTPSMEKNSRISLFVTELYLRNRVSDHDVSASSRPTGLWLSHVHAPVAASASKCFGFALWHKEFDDFSLFVLALSSSFHDFTA